MLRYRNIIYLIVVFAIVQNAEGRDTAQPAVYQIDDDLTFVISGTSNVRDWEASTYEIHGKVEFGRNAVDWGDGISGRNGASESGTFSENGWIEEVQLEIPVKSLDSGTNALNETMYRHLLSDDHPRVSYRYSEVKSIQAGDNPDILNLIVAGTVRAAGKDLPVEHEVQLTRGQGGVITVSGEFDLNMTDFDIDPPTFMRGALVTRDEFNIRYELTLVPAE